VSEQDEDFATLFEASVTTAKQFEKGQMIDGTIVAIGADVALVNVGAKSEAQIDVAELKDEDGDIDVAVGDRIQAKVVGTAGGLTLSRKGVRSATTQRELEDAYASGLAVEGRVERAVKGGYEVRIARERAFCPISQIDIARTVDPAVHEGKVYAFRIIEFKDGGRDLVVSRRAVLEEEQRAAADAVRAAIVPGAVLTGRVASVLDFGAFVDLGGGIQGLLHVSEMSWSRSTTASSLVAPGDAITVKVLRVDEASGKISLGLKQLGPRGQGHPAGRFRRVRRAGAWHRGPGPCVHLPALRQSARRGARGAGRDDRGVRDPERRCRAEAARRRAGGRRVRPGGERARRAGGDRAGGVGSRQGRAARAVRRVRLPRARPHRAAPRR
jgi:ribosomal protein S1